MGYKIKLQKADASTSLTSFDKRPNWKDLASKIANLFEISSPDDVGVAYVDKHNVETVKGEDELQKFYEEHPYDNDAKFVVQDLKAPDNAITSTWSKYSNFSDLSKSETKGSSNQVKRPGAPDVNRGGSKKLRTDVLPSESDLLALYQRLQNIELDPSQFSDPCNLVKFPFPFTYHQLPADRFQFTDSHFEYMGRTAFLEVWDTVKSLKTGSKLSRLYISGTMGYGKSHILAVLVGLLSRYGKRTIYLPDCRALLDDVVVYMQTALLCAFADPSSSDERNEIRGLKSQEDIVKFCRGHLAAYFVIDQMNALDANMDIVNNHRKETAMEFLNKLTVGNYQITSASASHKTAVHMAKKQTGDEKMALMGGMSEDEMSQWWIHHEGRVPTVSADDKVRVEDLTGRIPLLLRPLLHFSRTQFNDIERVFRNHSDLAVVRDHIVQFAAEKRKNQSQHYEGFYLSTLVSCLTGANVSGSNAEWFDHRYFYRDRLYRGKCTCGLAREAAAAIICQGSPGLLCDDAWIRSLRTFKNNPSVVGFIVEQACLSAISLTGFHHGNIHWSSLNATVFQGDILDAIPVPTTYEEFFIPEDPFFKDIDALYLKVDEKKKKALVVPIQITVAKTHKDSEASFYSRWSDWKRTFTGYDLETAFVWVIEDQRSWKEMAEEFKTTRNRSKLISPAHLQIILTVAELNDALGSQLAAIRS